MPLVAASTLALAQPTAEPIRLALIEGLSGPFANAGEAVFRNLLLATERINVLRDDRAVQRVYLIAQDYSFGQPVMKQSRLMIAAKRPAAFRQRFPERQDDCVHACMHLMLEMLATTLVPRIQSHLQGCRDRLVALVFCVAGPGAA